MLILALKPHVEHDGTRVGRFDACLDSERIVTSRQPRLDSARALLAMGYPPETLLNTRHEGRDYDNWREARPIGELAGWSVAEGDTRGLQRQRWRPFNGPVLRSGRVQDKRSPAEGREHAPDAPTSERGAARWSRTAPPAAERAA